MNVYTLDARISLSSFYAFYQERDCRTMFTTLRKNITPDSPPMLKSSKLRIVMPLREKRLQRPSNEKSRHLYPLYPTYCNERSYCDWSMGIVSSVADIHCFTGRPNELEIQCQCSGSRRHVTTSRSRCARYKEFSYCDRISQASSQSQQYRPKQ